MGHVESTRILLLGDSLDRMIVEALCESDTCGGILSANWAQGVLLNPNQPVTSLQPDNAAKICDCPKTNDSVAYVHLFGAKGVGPYYSGKRNTADDQLVDSKPRIDAALRIFHAKFPPPHRIVYHAGIWETQRLFQIPRATNESDEEWLALCLREYEDNMNERMDQVVQLASDLWHGVSFGMRTAVFDPHGEVIDTALRGGLLSHGFNNIVRKMASERGVMLYDYDYDIWSTVGWNYSPENTRKLLRDSHHPSVVWSRLAAEKYLYWR